MSVYNNRSSCISQLLGDTVTKIEQIVGVHVNDRAKGASAAETVAPPGQNIGSTSLAETR